MKKEKEKKVSITVAKKKVLYTWKQEQMLKITRDNSPCIINMK